MNTESAIPEQVHPFYQKGYDSWVTIWCQTGYFPIVRDCNARYLAEGSVERSEFIKGWNAAKADAMRNTK